MLGFYDPRNDQELTGAIPLYSVYGDLDATVQTGPTITPKTDITTFLGNGSPYGISPGSGLTALLMAVAVVAGAYILFKGNIKI